MARGYLVVEGQGDEQAALNLLNRLWAELGLPPTTWSDRPIRGTSLTTPAGLTRVCELVRPRRDASRLLILRDEDDACPRETAPRTAAQLRDLALPFPTAVVLLRREFEVLFLPCIDLMAGRELVDDRGVARAGLRPTTAWSGDPEAKRDVKGWLSDHMPAGRAYKPTLDQLPLTRMLDFGRLRASGLPCFGTLERALTFLASGEPGQVYPPPLAT